MKQICILVLLVSIVCANSFAAGLEDADYTTPDSWSQHVVSNGFKIEGKQHDLAGGNTEVSLTTRYNLESNDYASDQNIYQYLRVKVADVQLGTGTVSGAVFFRGATDIDGDDGKQWGETYNYFFNDTLDVEEEENDYAPRLYHAFVKLSDFVKGSQLTLGRMYVDHLSLFHLDGADADVSFADERLKLFAYGGHPVSFYVDNDDNSLYGGGIELKPFEKLKLRAAYTSLDIFDEDTDFAMVRADLFLDLGSLYGEYSSVDNSGYYKIGGTARISKTKTTVNVDYTELLDQIGYEDGSYVTNQFTNTLFPYGDYKKIRVKISQGVTDFLVLGVGTELKDADNTDLTNRDYAKYSAYIDLVRVPTENTYISLNADYWDVDNAADAGDNKSFTFGGQITQVVSDKLDVWAGTWFERFQYDEEDDEIRDWVRNYYVGGQYSYNDTFSVTCDLSYEDSEVLEKDSSDMKDTLSAEIWVNFSI